MTEQRKLYWRVGLFVGGAFMILAILIFFISEEQNLFFKMNSYTVLFTSAEGLDVGNPVKLNGVRVGRISDIRLPLEPDESKISLDISIGRKYTGLIRANSRARIRSLGLLGDKYIEVTSGSKDAPCILPGGRIPSTEPTDISGLLSRGEDTMDNLLAISASLRQILAQITTGDSPLHDMVARANSSMEHLDNILARIESKHGVIGRLINDEDLAAELVGNLTSATRDLRSISTRLAEDLEAEESVWNTFMHDREAGQRAVDILDNLGKISSSLAEISGKLEGKDEALLPRLMNDEAFAEAFLTDLRSTASHLESIAEKVDKGEGSAGMLISDPAIYEGIHNVLYGINHSRFLKWMIQKKRKKGEKAHAE